MLGIRLRGVILFLLLLDTVFMSKTQARLSEDEIKDLSRRYTDFRKQKVVNIGVPACDAVMFIHSLHQDLQEAEKRNDATESQKLAQEIIAIISEGIGVGGINTQRTATEDERKIIFGALSEAYSKGAKSITVQNPTGHQRVVQSVIETVSKLAEMEKQAEREKTRVSSQPSYLLSKDLYKTDSGRTSGLQSYNFIQNEADYKKFMNQYLWAYLETEPLYLKLIDKQLLEKLEKHFKEKIKNLSFTTQYDFIKTLLRVIDESGYFPPYQVIIEAFKNLYDLTSITEERALVTTHFILHHKVFNAKYISKLRFFKTLAELEQELQDNPYYSRFCEKLWQALKDESQKKAFKKFFQSVPAEQREDFFQQAEKFLSDPVWDEKTFEINRDWPYRIPMLEVLKLLKSLEPEVRKEFVTDILRILVPSMTKEQCEQAFDILLKIEPEQRKKFVEEVVTLLTSDIGTVQRLEILVFLFQVDSSERGDFTIQASRLLIGPINSRDRTSIILKLSQCPNTETRQQVVNQVLNLMQELNLPNDNISSVARYFLSVNPNQRQGFYTFLIQNRVSNLNHIEQLSQVANPNDWQATLNGIRGAINQGRGIQGGQQRPGMNNQTVHDKAYERSISEALNKLQTRYRSRPRYSLEDLQRFYLEKIQEFQKNKLLSRGEATTAHHFFTDGFDRLENRDKTQNYLNLAWQALNDREIAFELGSQESFNAQEINERIAGWLRAGPIDAQLAYHLDRLGSQSLYKTKVQLLEAVERDGKLITSGQSCVGGSYNRLIDALNLIHPDVHLALGEGNKKNIEVMARAQFLNTQMLTILEQLYQDSPEDFNARETIKQTTRKKLEESFIKEIETNYQGLSPERRQEELDRMMEDQFDKAYSQASPIKPIQDYIDKGLVQDLESWLDNYNFPTAQEVTDYTSNLMKKKLEALKDQPSDDIKEDLMDEANMYGKSIASQHRKRIYKNLILEILKDLNNQENFHQKSSEEQIKFFQQALQGKLKKDKNLVVVPDGNELRGVLAEHDIRQLITPP